MKIIPINYPKNSNSARISKVNFGSSLPTVSQLPKFEVINPELWAKIVKANSNSNFDQMVLLYTALWARKMEQAMSEGAKLEDIAESTSLTKDVEGSVDFTRKYAVGILSQVWKHGEALNTWYKGICRKKLDALT